MLICYAFISSIADLVAERGFLEILHDLISDSNPSVVANGVAALSEIAETSGRDVMKISASVLQKLLAALNECTEWGQVFILGENPFSSVYFLAFRMSSSLTFVHFK